MTEIFISYSRRDRAFVEKFIDGLKENGYSADDIWVDWQDIPPSAKWEDEIRKGIEETNAVVFILSPDWAGSKECDKELQVAAEYKKRLFPIICLDVDPKTIQPELASLNWIFFRETDNFDEALQKLLAALKTDLDWVNQHTVLLRRARRWESNERDSSYLLRDRELQAAEAWLSQAAEDKQPRPSQLQNEYIFASRQDEIHRQEEAARRQRRNLIMVSIGGVIALIMAIVAGILGFEAARQSQRALASELAAKANNLVHSQPDLALLLSLESNHIGDMLDETDAAWFGSLVTTLNSSPKLGRFLRAHQSDVRAVAVSPDSRWLASTGNPNEGIGQVILWDLNDAEMQNSYQTFTGGTQRLLTVGFNAEGTRMAAGGNEGKIYLWDPQNCCTPLDEMEVGGTIRALTFVKVKGKEYIAAAVTQEITFWDAVTGEKAPALTLDLTTDGVEIQSLAASTKNDLLAAGSDDGNVTVWDLNARALKFSLCSYEDLGTNNETVCREPGGGDTDIRGVAFNADGTLLAAGSSDRRVWLWDAQTGARLARSPLGNAGGHINTVVGVAFNPRDDSEVASVSWDNTVHLWHVEQEGERWRLNPVDTLAGHASSVWTLAYTPDGSHLVSGSSDKTVILWKLNQLNQIGTSIAKMERNVWALAAAWDGRQFAAGDEAGNIQVWQFDGETPGEPVMLHHPEGVLALAYSHNGQWLVSAGYDGTILVWDTATWTEAWRIEEAHTDQIWGLEFTLDDSRLASISFDRTAKIWDTATHAPVGIPLEHNYDMYALAFTNDEGTQLLTAGYLNDIHLWDVSNPASPQQLSLLKGHSAFVNSLAFNRDFPPLLASTSDDKTLLIWDVNRNEHTPAVEGLSESMEAVTFSPDGEMLASATNNSTILLWQVDSEQCSDVWNKDTCQPTQLGTPLTGHQAQVQNVVFLSDTKLVSSSADGQLILWNLDKKYWYDHACNVVRRNFTDSEKPRYITKKLNPVLLNVVAWLSDPFDADPPLEMPYCLQENMP